MKSVSLFGFSILVCTWSKNLFKVFQLSKKTTTTEPAEDTERVSEDIILLSVSSAGSVVVVFFDDQKDFKQHLKGHKSEKVS